MKTVREIILSYPGLSDGEDYLAKVLVDRSINGAASYTSKDKNTVALAAADVYAVIGGLPDFQENKLSLTYPRSWYKQKAKELYIEGGEPEKAESLGKKIEVPKGRARNRW